VNSPSSLLTLPSKTLLINGITWLTLYAPNPIPDRFKKNILEYSEDEDEGRVRKTKKLLM
jgi:hypothetical protein